MADEHGEAEGRFLDHYRKHYALSGRPYRDYQAAYQFGWGKACEGTYRGHEWSRAVERDLRTQWNQRTTAMRWDDVRGAIREGYEWGHQSMLR
jgi:hypothetical protein